MKLFMISLIILSIPVRLVMIILPVTPNIGNFSDFISFSRVLSNFSPFQRLRFLLGLLHSVFLLSIVLISALILISLPLLNLGLFISSFFSVFRWKFRLVMQNLLC